MAKPKVRDKPLEKTSKEYLLWYYSKAKKDYDNIINYYEDVNLFTKPYYSQQEDMVSKDSRRYDMFILNQVDGLNNYLMATLMPRGDQWGKAEVDKDMLELLSNASLGESQAERDRNIDNINKELEKGTNKVFKYLGNSNAYDEITVANYDCITCGSGVFKTIDTGNPLRPLRVERCTNHNTYFKEDSLGRIIHIFRLYKGYNYKDFKAKYPKANWIDGNTNNERTIDFYEYVIPDGEMFKFGVVTNSFGRVLYEELLEYNPYIIYRFRKHSANSYGVGQGMWCLDWFRDHVKYTELDMEQANRLILPSLIAYGDKGLVNALNLEAGYLNYGGLNKGSGNSLVVEQAIPDMRLNVLENQIRKIEEDIRLAFMTNPLGTVEETAGMTATESQIRATQFRDQFSGVYERLVSELLNPLFINTLHILQKNGLVDLDNEIISISKISFQNAIAESYNNEQVNKVLKVLQTAQYMLGDSAREILVNKGKVRDYLIRTYNSNAEPFNTNEEMKEAIRIMMATQERAILENRKLEAMRYGNIEQSGNSQTGGINQEIPPR